MKYCFNFLSIEKKLCTLSLNIRYFHAPPSVDAEQSWDWVLIFFVGYKISALPPFFIRNIFVGYKVSAPLPPTKTLHIGRTNMVQKMSKKCKIWRKKLLAHSLCYIYQRRQNSCSKDQPVPITHHSVIQSSLEAILCLGTRVLQTPFLDIRYWNLLLAFKYSFGFVMPKEYMKINFCFIWNIGPFLPAQKLFILKEARC